MNIVCLCYALCLLDTKVKDTKGLTPLEFYVVQDNVRPLLGLESCLDL